MKLGAIFPQLEIGADPGAVREYAQTVEGLGYNHVGVYDHVLGADPSYYRDWSGPYTSKSLFHEPFVLYGYLAAITKRLELATEIIILPQRQTVLVAKQAAEVDVLSGGRLRLGVGIGWNRVEYEGLGQDFHTRGRRSDEQVRLLKALWTQEVVTFEGRWEKVTAAGLNPMPVQRPIPIWFGGGEEPVLRRVANLGDGWFPQGAPTNPVVQQRLEMLKQYLREAGRNPAAIGIEGRASAANATPEDWAKTAAAWKELGATHLCFNTMGAGFTTLAEHLEALHRFHEVASDTVGAG
ncbi:MAG: LLM class F420-dependent oxidoreductase [Chloroflexi bacterium]|nr:LLM class F420-dependent oxidoreductase [Chloroflexota bacterium]